MRTLSVRSRGANVYEWRFQGATIGGKRKWISKSGYKTRTAAYTAGMEALRLYEKTGDVFRKQEMSFADFLVTWLDIDCADLKATTITNYEKIIRLHIIPSVGKYSMKSLSKELLQQFIFDEFDRGVSLNSLSVYKSVLSKALGFAVDNHYILYSPAERLKMPRTRQPACGASNKSERIVIPRETMLRIYERFPEGTSVYVPFHIGYECGLRIGEVFALTWDDIDLDAKIIYVNRQVQWKEDTTRSSYEKSVDNGTSKCGNGYWYFSPPKYNSKRIVEISDSLAAILSKEKKKQQALEAVYDDLYNRYYCASALLFRCESNEQLYNPIGTSATPYRVHFVCVSESGKYNSERVTQHAARVIRKDIIDNFNFHSLRHTHATQLAERGVSMKYIQERLGHKNIELTINTYTHVTETMRAEGRRALNDMDNDTNT